jgi:hypothetical protein
MTRYDLEPPRRVSGFEPGPAHPSQIIVGYAGSPILGGTLSTRGYEEAASSLSMKEPTKWKNKSAILYCDSV